ncbi:shikimate dehydrogenase family protein [Raoultibacter phocaeensis]|uniref:shikimate dehydrogenase family protein n=1 Tax=Raoultibacter phocaeensis TaxID=2479841 RepID=UPI0011198D43|nr:shikimate dehydrogenase [Raoultibacter phocaeensis]
MEHLYLLGHPIGHSKSPAMYHALYAELGLPWNYASKDCATEDEARAFLEAREFFSINITTPYKPLAFEVATMRSATAKLACGANMLVRKNGALIAYNVDGEGCVDYLERTGFRFSGAEVVVCGTGPTALSIFHACALAGARRVVLVGRDLDRTRDAFQAYTEQYRTLAYATVDLPVARENRLSFRTAFEKVDFAFGSYETATKVFTEADLIVNATPLGMRKGDPAPFDTSLLREGQTVFDAVYGHGLTALVSGAEAAGCTVFDGQGMLVAQAVATATALLDIAGVDTSLTREEMFDIMAEAAGFDL